MSLHSWCEWKYLRYDRFRYHAQEAWHSWEQVHAQVQRKIAPRLWSDIQLLDVGCGRFYPHLVLFESIGVQVTGIDIEPVLQHSLDPLAIRLELEKLGRGASLYQVMRALARNYYHRWVFYRPLGLQASFPLVWRQLDIRKMDATEMSFEDASFDVVTSNDTFEHITDVPKVTAEVRRGLKPDGFAVVNVHLFPSLTGGHEPELGYHRIRKKLDRPWGHLYDPNWKAPSVLNRWRDRDYHRAFKDQFSSVERKIISQFGQEFLSREILDKLPDYTVDELLTEKVMYVLNP